MRKIYIKIMAFIYIVVSLFSYVNSISVKAMSTNSEYKVNYTFKTEAGVSIPHKVFQIYDCLHWPPSF